MSTKSMHNLSLEHVSQALSTERLAPYLAAVQHADLQSAFALYQWNIEISGAFHEGISVAEVCLRNTLHNQLTVLTNGMSGSWFDHSHTFLTTDAQLDISVAMTRVTRKGGHISPGRLVSELNFGFWRYLIAKRYETTLWTPALRNGFPQLESQQRRMVFETVSELNVLRNRIAHHEPIFKRNLREDFMRVFRLINWISPETREWAVSFSRIKQSLDNCPNE